MLDSILGGLKDQIPGDLLEKVGLDPSKAGDVASIAGESAKEEVSKQLASGAMGTVMNLFSKGSNSSSASSLKDSLTSNFVGKLGTKLGLSESMANTLASAIIPKVLAMITNKNEETAATDTSAIASMFGGTDGMMDSAKGMLGGLFK
jgi:uncharacterized protein YidB (DUF937 family)